MFRNILGLCTIILSTKFVSLHMPEIIKLILRVLFTTVKNIIFFFELLRSFSRFNNSYFLQPRLSILIAQIYKYIGGDFVLIFYLDNIKLLREPRVIDAWKFKRFRVNFHFMGKDDVLLPVLIFWTAGGCLKTRYKFETLNIKKKKMFCNW